jgi:oligoribonuclease
MALKYFSVDIETTGLDFENNQIIEFGAIFEDPSKQLPFSEIPKFKRIIRHDKYIGQAIAIHMNARIFKILADYDMKKASEKELFAKEHNIITPGQLMDDFLAFVIQCYTEYGLNVPVGGINIAGKNFPGFDGRFIENLKRDYGMNGSLRFKHVVGDPATLYTDFYNDETFAGLQTCKDLAGINGIVSHDALEDAWDVVQVLRKKY